MLLPRSRRVELRAAQPPSRPRRRRRVLMIGAAVALAASATMVVRHTVGATDAAEHDSAPTLESPQPTASTTAPVPAGLRRATIDVTGTGFARAGDLVDVSATFPPDFVDGPPTLRILRRVPVVEIAPLPNDTTGRSRVALAVAVEDVEKLAFADEHATLSLSVHPPGDDGQGTARPLPSN